MRSRRVDDLTRVLSKRRKAMQPNTKVITRTREDAQRVGARLLTLGALLTLTMLALALALAKPAAAQNWRGSESDLTADGRLVDVQVQVDGRSQPLFLSPQGDQRLYFQALKGRNYSLVVRNTTGRRIGLLIAVDGINVVNGERSGLRSNESMYVLDPWERTVIRGWRSSMNDVRRFVFVDEERSYAERTGQANGDLGWIRVLAFNERGARIGIGWGKTKQLYGDGGPAPERRGQEDEIRPYSREEKDQNGDQPQEGERGEVQKRDAAPQTRNYSTPPESQSSPGTGWGQQQWDPVQRVTFFAEPRPVDHLVLRYEYAAGLRALGIFPRSGRDRLWEREHGELGFAQPPRW
jgi:hypothetical protein